MRRDTPGKSIARTVPLLIERRKAMYVLGIDIGTTGAKAIVADEKGHIAGQGYKSYGLITGAGSKVEQNPADWYNAAVYCVHQACKDIDANSIRALSLSTQGGSSLLVDEHMQPLTNALTWMDSRAVKEKEELEKLLGDEYVYATTGWKTHPSLDMAKLKWLVDHENELYNKAKYFISTLEYMNYRLTGECVIDPSNGAIRQLLNIRTRKWDQRILDAIGTTIGKLAPILPTGAIVGKLTQSAAQDMGLNQNVTVYNGAHDQYCGAIGAGIVNPGEFMLSTGTAWVAMAESDEPLYSKAFIAPGPHIVGDKYGAIASLPISGAALDWLKNNIISEEYATIDKIVESRVQQASDLYFYPYFSGAEFPLWQMNARAAFIGLGLQHDKYDMALAVMEGVAFQLKMALNEFKNSGLEIKCLRMMGGVVNSPMWTKIVAAVCDCDLYIMDVKDTPCIGAAIIAGVQTGMYQGYESAANRMNQNARYDQDVTSLQLHYSRKFDEYQRAWEWVSEFYI